MIARLSANPILCQPIVSSTNRAAARRRRIKHPGSASMLSGRLRSCCLRSKICTRPRNRCALGTRDGGTQQAPQGHLQAAKWLRSTSPYQTSTQPADEVKASLNQGVDQRRKSATKSHPGDNRIHTTRSPRRSRGSARPISRFRSSRTCRDTPASSCLPAR